LKENERERIIELIGERKNIILNDETDIILKLKKRINS